MRIIILRYCISVFLFALLFSIQILGQSDSSIFTPFSKGRSFVSLNGSISSSVNNRSSKNGNTDRVLNNYLLEMRLAKIVARNFAFGLSFSTEKYSSKQLIRLDTEVLALGPWGAYYLTNGQPGGLFIQGALLYINYYERNQLISNNPQIEDYAAGVGFAGALGFGYTYVLFDIVGLEVSMNFRQARIYGELTNSVNQQTSFEAFNRVDFSFKFGFIVLFNKLNNG